MSEIDSVTTYRRIAEVLRSAQRVAIEIENAPEKRKRLRTFSFQEAAALLGISLREVIARSKTAAETEAPSRNRISLEEILSLRQSVHAETHDLRILPWRRPDRGEGLATVVFSNFKGGSAKTTSSVHFAQYLARARLPRPPQSISTVRQAQQPSSE